MSANVQRMSFPVRAVNKVLSNLFIALLLHKFDNDYCQKVSGALRVRTCPQRLVMFTISTIRGEGHGG